MGTLFIAISAHGFGHLAQTGPVVEQLRRTHPSLRLVVQTALPEKILTDCFGVSFEWIPEPADIGMVMSSALDVSREASIGAYEAFHRAWDEKLHRQVKLLRKHRADLVFSNVSYLPLAAAARAGIPAVAMCSLNWLDIHEACCGSARGVAGIRDHMRDAYMEADHFLIPEPGMPMEWLPNRRAIGPVARVGRSRRGELARQLGVAPGERVVLLSLGGIPTTLPLERWPEFPGIRFVVSGVPPPARAGFHDFHELGLPYIDVLCSVDALVTKPGYGSFVEAAVNGIPVLYLPRDGWPEAAYLTNWLERVVPCRRIARSDFEKGRFQASLFRLLSEGRAEGRRLEPAGVAEAAALLASYLGS